MPRKTAKKATKATTKRVKKTETPPAPKTDTGYIVAFGEDKPKEAAAPVDIIPPAA